MYIYIYIYIYVQTDIRSNPHQGPCSPVQTTTPTICRAAKHPIIGQHDVVALVEGVLTQIAPLHWRQRLRNHAVLCAERKEKNEKKRKKERKKQKQYICDFFQLRPSSNDFPMTF